MANPTRIPYRPQFNEHVKAQLHEQSQRLITLHLKEDFALASRTELQATVGASETYKMLPTGKSRRRLRSRDAAAQGYDITLQAVRLPTSAHAERVYSYADNRHYVLQRRVPEVYRQSTNHQVEQQMIMHHHPNFLNEIHHPMTQHEPFAQENIQFFEYARALDFNKISPTEAFLHFKELLHALVYLHRHTGKTIADNFDLRAVRICDRNHIKLNFLPMVPAKAPNLLALSKLYYCMLANCDQAPKVLNDLSWDGALDDLNLKHYFYKVFNGEIHIDDLPQYDFMIKLSAHDVDKLLSEHWLQKGVPLGEPARTEKKLLCVDLANKINDLCTSEQGDVQMNRRQRIVFLNAILHEHQKQLNDKAVETTVELSSLPGQALASIHTEFDALKDVLLARFVEKSQVLALIETHWQAHHLSAYFNKHPKHAVEMKQQFASALSKMINYDEALQTHSQAQRLKIVQGMLIKSRDTFYESNVLQKFYQGDPQATHTVRDALREAKQQYFYDCLQIEDVVALLNSIWPQRKAPRGLEHPVVRQLAFEALGSKLARQINLMAFEHEERYPHQARMDYLEHLLLSNDIFDLFSSDNALAQYLQGVPKTQAAIEHVIFEQIRMDDAEKLDRIDILVLISKLWHTTQTPTVLRENVKMLNAVQQQLASIISAYLNQAQILLSFTASQRINIAKQLLVKLHSSLTDEQLSALYHHDPKARRSLQLKLDDFIDEKFNRALEPEDVGFILHTLRQDRTLPLASIKHVDDTLACIESVICTLINGSDCFQEYNRDQRMDAAQKLLADVQTQQFFKDQELRLINGIKHDNYIDAPYILEKVKVLLHKQHADHHSARITQSLSFHEVRTNIQAALAEYQQPTKSIGRRIRMRLFGPSKLRVRQMADLNRALSQLQQLPLDSHTQAQVAIGLVRHLLQTISQKRFGKNSHLQKLLRSKLGACVDSEATDLVLQDYHVLLKHLSTYAREGIITYKNIETKAMLNLLLSIDMHRQTMLDALAEETYVEDQNADALSQSKAHLAHAQKKSRYTVCLDPHHADNDDVATFRRRFTHCAEAYAEYEDAQWAQPGTDRTALRATMLPRMSVLPSPSKTLSRSMLA